MIYTEETKNKLRRLRWLRPILAALPYTRVIFLAGSVARNCPAAESDIDLVIVSRDKRVWLNRFFMELDAFILGRRRSQKKFKNRFCFNIFLSREHSLLPHQDAAAAEMYQYLKPIWSRGEEEVENFWNQNSWLKKFASPENQTSQNIFEKKLRAAAGIGSILETLLELSGAGWLLEKLTFRFQTKYLKNKFAEKCGDEKSEADFFITPELIAYHFPVSHHSQALKKYRAQLADVEKLPLPTKDNVEQPHKTQ